MTRMEAALGRRDHLSFKGNLAHTRYGWLRLTPAYSIHLIADLLPPSGKVLDPFCGTGTTALVCAENGLACDTTDINPFLIWLATAKARTYSERHLRAFATAAAYVADHVRGHAEDSWTPALFQIEKWWDAPTLGSLSRAMYAIRRREATDEVEVVDLLKVAFCRTMIERANVSFGHQSMSFKKKEPTADLLPGDRNEIAVAWSAAARGIARSASSPVAHTPRALYCDARDLAPLVSGAYAAVVTSPPYPNRMSYIRELRPYMYWLGYLSDGRAAGELDWQAIGGTWGCATSNVGKWSPPTERRIPFDGFYTILDDIAQRSPLLSRYVHRYFYDMLFHVDGLLRVVAPGGQVHYIVGNSKFYDVLLPVERIFADIFAAAGFASPAVRVIRKRSSKKELFEYVVTATKPTATTKRRQRAQRSLA